MKSISYLNDPYTNTIAVIILTIVSYILTLSMNIDGSKLGTLIYLFYPSLIALATLMLYFISRLCFKKYNWIISCAGVGYMTYWSVLLNWNMI